MTATFAWYTIGAITAGLLCSIAIWAPRQRALKLAALVCVCLFLGAAYSGLTDMQGRPRGLALTQLQAWDEDAQVIGSRMVEDEAIYLWLQQGGMAEPRYYKMPWDEQLARSLHEAGIEAEGEGTEVKMRKSAEANDENREPVFYAAAPPPLPHKQAQKHQPMVVKAADDTNTAPVTRLSRSTD